jgi:2-haloacid dehalogenase
MEKSKNIRALTFDLFGTILDLGGSLTPFIAKFLQSKDSEMSPDRFWEQWRYRQRIEQYQDNIMMLGHCGYLEAARRALVYTLAWNGMQVPADEVRQFMAAWQELSPFPDVLPALSRLKGKYRLVVLSNGEAGYLEYLVKNRLHWDFDSVISVEVVGAFKPHPGVYRRAASILRLEVGECMMVSAHPFDLAGARACGYRAAYVNRYRYPYEDSPFQPDTTVKDFHQLADILLS